MPQNAKEMYSILLFEILLGFDLSHSFSYFFYLYVYCESSETEARKIYQ